MLNLGPTGEVNLLEAVAMKVGEEERGRDSLKNKQTNTLSSKERRRGKSFETHKGMKGLLKSPETLGSWKNTLLILPLAGRGKQQPFSNSKPLGQAHKPPVNGMLW